MERRADPAQGAPQTALLLLRYCSAYSKLSYAMHVTPLEAHTAALQQGDSSRVRAALEQIGELQLGETAYRQTSLKSSTVGFVQHCRVHRSPRSLSRALAQYKPQSLRLTSCRPASPAPAKQQTLSAALDAHAFPEGCACPPAVAAAAGFGASCRGPWPVPGASILSCASPCASPPPPCVALRGLRVLPCGRRPADIFLPQAACAVVLSPPPRPTALGLVRTTGGGGVLASTLLLSAGSRASSLSLSLQKLSAAADGDGRPSKLSGAWAPC